MRGAPLRVYADTSVFGGCFDAEFATASNAFIEQVRRRRFVLLVSSLVEDELAGAPQAVQDLLQELRAWIEPAAVTGPVRDLADSYVAEGVVSERSSSDALHVATAVVARADVIVSWNFRHIVHFQKIKLYNAVNTLNGYDEIAIHSPAEVLTYGEEL